MHSTTAASSEADAIVDQNHEQYSFRCLRTCTWSGATVASKAGLGSSPQADGLSSLFDELYVSIDEYSIPTRWMRFDPS